ncbi:TetR/AcrR family transcriptional regulator [Sphingomonas jatrophae]|uniref:Transcriptional regulator, TetR family n=1 Tax=Sphingomonas jatrophae TaxID=1166337 RepID=A0A1I6MD39_9SPHN|nr:TetR/AcrR family transcriptional regulator [Sphingomonas jatrophae]SFS13639.1 transcriptional regulator, TetR family [Sphingomonas jatrophae]
MTDPAEPDAKTPKTARGQRTLRALLDAATEEFAQKGFHDAAISEITKRAGVAIGSFYTYFDSKEAIFTALVRDLSERVRGDVAPALRAAPDPIARERAGQRAYLEFVGAHREIYRIVDQAEFVAPESYRAHYETTAGRIATRLEEARQSGDISDGDAEIRAWAIMGMNVFLGLRFGVWSDDADFDKVAAVGGDLIAFGLSPDRA